MRKQQLARILQAALLVALGPVATACGGSVEGDKADTGVSETAVDTKIDDKSDTSDDSAKSDVFDTGTPDTGTVDTGADTAFDVGGDTPDSCVPIIKRPFPGCDAEVKYPCGLPITLKGEYPDIDECNILCEGSGVTPSSGCNMGSIDRTTVRCGFCGVGRRPSDLENLQAADRCSEQHDVVGQALAEQAWMEAASVHAFGRLARTLARLNAPKALRLRARKAAQDEARHARLVGSLALRRGVKPQPIHVSRTDTVPSTYELARENFVEGCVHETLGVAYLAHQQQHATDPALREMAATLYEDELEHASLSWDLVAFFDSKLTIEERLQLRVAQGEAFDQVLEQAEKLDPTVVATFGLPGPLVVQRLVTALRGSLYPN